MRTTRFVAFWGLVLAACGNSPTMAPVKPPKDTTAADTTTLRQLMSAHGGRYIGGATGQLLTRTGTLGDSERALAARELSMLWSGNFLKFSVLRPTRTTFAYANADSMVAFAQRNNMVVRGHTIAWHNQLPTWLTTVSWSADSAKAILKDHIDNVLGHYRGKLAAWDVVNEAIDDAGHFRTGFWLNTIGPEYIEDAFRWARAADPAVPLYYNDYNIEAKNAKSDSVYELIRSLKAKGVPIDGIGLQGHFTLGSMPTKQQLIDNMNRFAALGLKIQFTEVDIRILLPATPQNFVDQATAYRDLFDACLQVPACNAVELGGIYDGDWGSPDGNNAYGAALLFDANLLKKSAYYAVKTLLSGA